MKSILLTLLLLGLPQLCHADLMNGLVAWWKLDEGSGATAADSSGHGNTASLTNISWTPGIKNNGISLNGTSAYLDTGTKIETLTSTAGSISLWANHSRAYNSGADDALANEQAALEFNMLHWHDNNLYFGFGNHRITIAASATNWPQNTWTHYCLTWANGSATTIYINGVSVASASPTTAQSPGVNLRFGYYYYSGSYYSGKEDDIRIYNRALTPTEINDLYLGGLGRVVYGKNSIIAASKTSY